MIAWWAWAAWASSLWVVPEQGELHPLQPAIVAVSAVDNLGEPLTPEVATSSGRLRVVDRPETPGVVEMEFTPSAEPGPVKFTMADVGEVVLPVTEFRQGVWKAPARVEVPATERRVPVALEGPITAEALRFAVSEGELVEVRPTATGVEVVFQLSESSQARSVAVAFWDVRRQELPQWTTIRVRARPAIDIETEPGAKVSLILGRRSYGPFVADTKGVVRPVIDQYPGEASAQVTLVDDLGNETRTTLSLPAPSRGGVFVFATGPLQPRAPVPTLFAMALGIDGLPWSQAPLQCQTPAASEVVLRAVGAGAWQVSAPGLRNDQDLRLRCEAAGEEAVFRMPVDPRVPTGIDVRVWPLELSSEFPIAEFQASLQNAVGDRVEPHGLSVRAHHGTLVFDDAPGVVLRGEFNAAKAVLAGEDRLVARYDAPLSTSGMVHQIRASGWLDREGEARLSARVLDEWSLPIAGVSVRFALGEQVIEAQSGVDGWAVAQIDVEPGFLPLVLTAEGTGRRGQALLVREVKPLVGPGAADLEVVRVVPLRTGRVQRLDVSIEPPVLYTGNRARATVRVVVRDSSGAVVDQQPETAEASKGTLGPWVPAEEGAWVAEYIPPNGDNAHTVRIDVRVESAVSSATLQLEPRPIDRSAMFSFGMMTNFGAILSPYVSADFDWRSPLLKRKIFIRFGLGYYGDQTEVSTGPNTTARLRTTLFPVHVTAIARTDLRGNGLWGGIGILAAPYISEGRFGSDSYTQLRIYPPGLQVLAGVGRRLGVGEVVFEVRGVALTSPGGEFGLSGPVGGLGAVLGYRVVY